MREISHEELGNLLRGRMGLIVGPSVVQHSGFYSGLAKDLATTLQVEPDEDYRIVGDRAVASGKTHEEIRLAIRSLMDQSKQSSFTSHLARGKWSAVLSATLETSFEDKMQAFAERQPNRRRIVTMNDLSMPLVPRSIPVFKLLGIANREDFATTSATYKSRMITWRKCLPLFADHVKGSPVLCVGMGDCPTILVDIIGELMADRHACPKYILLLSDDPIAQNRIVLDFAEPTIQLLHLPGTISDIVGALTECEKSGYTLPLPFADPSSASLESLAEFDEICTVVNTQIVSGTSSAQSVLLQDILFSPSIPRWDPFVHQLDLERTTTSELLSKFKGIMSAKHGSDFVTILHGNAASGKTTLLKSLALQLARDKNLVLWLRPTFAPDPQRVIRALFSRVANLNSAFPSGVICFLDDPIGFGSLTAEDIVSSARLANVRLALIVGVRTTDFSTFNKERLHGACPVLLQEELSDLLDEAEWKRVPEFLMRLGICGDIHSAENICAFNDSRSARDTLCVMYLLAYGSRESIFSSIRGEYYRLGDHSVFARLILGATSHSTDLLKRAYEMVAVSDFYRTPLPIEVLVAALDVDYTEWLDASPDNGPAWGLLYSDADNDGNVMYRTRNFVVTETLINTLNGGAFGHSGELRVLQTLINGCHGRSAAVYREFLSRLLISNDTFSRLEFAEGLDLFESAIAALPHPDRTLLHHKGRWIKKRGKNAAQAMEVYDEALKAPPYPYAERAEAKEHIHTSYAAAAIAGIESGEIEMSRGKEIVLEHLSKARSPDFFNPNAAHVQGKLVLNLVKNLDASDAVDSLTLLNQAVSDIERTILVLRGSNSPSSGSDVMLEDMMAKLFFATSNMTELSQTADRLWVTYNNQEGFVMLLRKKLSEAREINRGSNFNAAFDTYVSIVRTIEQEGAVPVIALHEAALELLYAWYVNRPAKGSRIDWAMVESIASRALAGRMIERQNVIHRFMFALALCQQQRWTDASQYFTSLRRSSLYGDLLWRPRYFFSDAQGEPRVFQATMRCAGGKWYAFVEEINKDFIARARESWPREGEICHVYLRFSFAGPIATKNLSMNRD